MKDLPILFSASMVRALLNGSKTQTRRVMKPQPTGFVGGPGVQLRNGSPAPLVPIDEDAGPCGREIRCPYGQPGDRLWVRETCRADELPDGLDGVRYLADRGWRAIENTRQAADDWVKLNHYCGKRGATVPAIHMPRWASRITLEVTGVRVERLQDISEADAIAEGIERWDGSGNNEWADYSDPAGLPLSARESYRTLWEQINGPGSWDANPWVWAVDFRRLQ